MRFYGLLISFLLVLSGAYAQAANMCQALFGVVEVAAPAPVVAPKRNSFGFTAVDLKRFGILPNSLAARFVELSRYNLLLNQSEKVLEKNLLPESEQGGLCGPTCMVNIMSSVQVLEPGRSDARAIKTEQASQVDFILNSIENLTGGSGDARYGTSYAQRVMAFFRLSLKTQTPLLVEHVTQSRLRPITEADLVTSQTGQQSLKILSLNTGSGGSSAAARHVVVLLGINTEKKILLYSDPNSPQPRSSRYQILPGLKIQLLDTPYSKTEAGGVVNSVETITFLKPSAQEISAQATAEASLGYNFFWGSSGEKNRSFYYLNTVQLTLKNGSKLNVQIEDFIGGESTSSSYLVVSSAGAQKTQYELILASDIIELQ